MPYEFYKVLHIAGILVLFTALSAIACNPSQNRKLNGILHGLSLVVILVAGFGLLARLQIGFVPGWVWAKLVIWFLFGALIALNRRMAVVRRFFWIIGPGLGILASFLAVYKPF